MKFTVFSHSRLALLCVLFTAAAFAQETADPNRLTVIKEYDPTKLIPFHISGYSGEVDRVLRFDLEVAGFKMVEPERAAYKLAGGNEAAVRGVLSDRNQAGLFNKTFNGGTVRQQAHAMADAVVLALTGKKGIAQTRIAFKMGAGRGSEIFVSDYDGHHPVPVTADGVVVAAPAWAPGNHSLYYTAYLTLSGVENTTILAHNLGTGEREIVARYSGLNTAPALANDGRVAMILSRANSPDVWIGSSTGKNLRRLTETRDEDESSPCWSPDNRWVAFVTKMGGRRVLAKAAAEGGPITRIATAGVLNPSEPSWSPDGTTLAFTAQMGGFSICVVPAEGGEAKVLADGEDPSWAPNSRTIVFAKRSGGKRILSLLDVPTKQVKDVPAFSGSSSQPAWAR
jgi:TolB protein